MAHTVRRALVLFAVVVVLGCIPPGCSGASSEGGAVGSSGQVETAAIAVQITSPFLTVEVENRTGRPLVDMRVTLKAGVLMYAAAVPRLETSEKRVLSPSEFRGSRDGAVFNPSVVRPKEILIAASDLDGKKYEVTAPWKQ
jgi:hypothetical protein